MEQHDDWLKHGGSTKEVAVQTAPISISSKHLTEQFEDMPFGRELQVDSSQVLHSYKYFMWAKLGPYKGVSCFRDYIRMHTPC